MAEWPVRILEYIMSIPRSVTRLVWSLAFIGLSGSDDDATPYLLLGRLGR